MKPRLPSCDRYHPSEDAQVVTILRTVSGVIHPKRSCRVCQRIAYQQRGYPKRQARAAAINGPYGTFLKTAKGVATQIRTGKYRVLRGRQ